MSSHLNLKRWFNDYNRRYFNGELPADTQIVWAPINAAHGMCWPQNGVIHIDPPLQSVPKFARIILLHEMCHLKRPRAGHGKVWQAEMHRLYEAGAFRRLL